MRTLLFNPCPDVITQLYLNTTGKVGHRPQSLATENERIIVDMAGNISSGKARSNLKALGGWDREHGMGELRFEFIEAWLAETGGDVANNANYSSTD